MSMCPRSLVHFEGAGGFLETTFTCQRFEEATILLADDGVLFSFAPRLDNVKELQITVCPIHTTSDLDHLAAAAMPNLDPISPSRCAYDNTSNNG